MKENNLANELELWGIEKDFTLFTDGSIGFGLDITPIDVSSFDDDNINQFTEALKNFINSLPPNTDIQFVQDIKAGNDQTINDYENLNQNPDNILSNDLAIEKISSFRTMDEAGVLPFHSLKVFIRKPFESALVKSSLFVSKKKSLKITEENLNRELKTAERLKNDILQQFESLNLEATLLPANEILKLVYKQWNPTRQENLQRYNPENVRDDLLFTDVYIDESGFDLSNMHHRVISLKSLPENTFASMARLLRHLPFDSRTSLSVHVPDQTKEIESLQSQRRVAFSMAMGKTSGVSDLESHSKLRDLEELLEEMIATGEKIFHVSLNILLRSHDEEDLNDQVSQTLSLIRELSGSEGLVETIASFDIFKQMSVPNARSKERSRRLKTSNLSDLIPIYAPWRGHPKPSLMLRSSAGSLLSFDPFDSSHTNANQLISAGSGAGKSVFCNLFILQTLKENSRVFFVDIGGSYQKLCENLDGQYIPLGVDCNISINPFDLPPGEKEPSHHKIKFLVGLVELMTKEETSLGLPKLIRSALEEAIVTVYEEQETPRLSHLREYLLNSDSSKLRDVGNILKSWCGESAFGQFIDRETNVELNKDLIAFDLKGLESFDELQTVCLYLITDLIWSHIQNDRYRMKFVVFDECWKLLKDKAGQEFIESIFRTCRKYFTSCIAISQAIQDFAESEIASAIVPNCSIKWLLQQGQSNSDAIKKHLGLNDNEVELVNGLKQKQGHYSEAYLLSGPKNRSVISVEPTPLELWIATTNPKDLKLIEEMKLQNSGRSQLEVLKELSQKYPHGV